MKIFWNYLFIPLKIFCCVAFPTIAYSELLQYLEDTQQTSKSSSQFKFPRCHDRGKPFAAAGCYNLRRNFTAFLCEPGRRPVLAMCDEFESLVQDTLRWHQDTYKDFPLDPIKENSVRFMVRGAIFSAVRPSPFRTSVQLAASSPAALKLLDLQPEIGDNSHFVDIVAGNDAIPGVPSLAHRYGGHQFGFWAEQLGDGRAHLIGEYTNR